MLISDQEDFFVLFGENPCPVAFFGPEGLRFANKAYEQYLLQLSEERSSRLAQLIMQRIAAYPALDVSAEGGDQASKDEMELSLHAAGEGLFLVKVNDKKLRIQNEQKRISLPLVQYSREMLVIVDEEGRFFIP
ncbi:hypothetical protein A3SI_10934 [Nitritalea halalkaliphila LW7]|uniref:Uncharacterized protein n=1 Tax=Nitritalea halalkaliphila LW7 TaxID=1189621 RepID=I5C2U2_9BACT|nr:hypothetical protein [Nitritalea halalkaliphila]EIM76144.1 hypothetical protein A3SI_10934 [Nitritalea halalkaliphila LW7]